ncbi:MAG TPA: toll/interleukin-1 receptor domain-containing protein [Pirellulales bacterium]|nr:toll/interleukin-1 receptor domain-containing protein [Pirellulales bacterium]
MPPLEVFLSHASADHDMAERLATLLRGHGIPTFYSPSNLLGAQQWQDEILKALQRCDWFVVLLSPDAIESMWVRRETALALRDKRFEDKIIPVRYRPCDLGRLGWLEIFQMVDFQGDFDQGCRNLLRIWGIGLKSHR